MSNHEIQVRNRSREATNRRNRVAMLSRAGGHTIVEVMVALTISLLVMVGVASLFASSRTTYQADEGLAHLQENARFASDVLNREIRMAGLFGCMPGTDKSYTKI